MATGAGAAVVPGAIAANTTTERTGKRDRTVLRRDVTKPFPRISEEHRGGRSFEAAFRPNTSRDPTGSNPTGNADTIRAAPVFRRTPLSKNPQSPPTAPPSSRIPVPWGVVLAGAAIAFLVMGARQTLGVFLIAVTEELGSGRESYSLAVAILSLLMGLPVGGYLADRFDPRRVLLGSAVIYGIA
ncbi:MAG: MFS transporter, partial [Acidimicrobiia bacterium]|nr:MFS transporter [Acidimicrobiia bacterium]